MLLRVSPGLREQSKARLQAPLAREEGQSPQNLCPRNTSQEDSPAELSGLKSQGEGPWLGVVPEGRGPVGHVAPTDCPPGMWRTLSEPALLSLS